MRENIYGPENRIVSAQLGVGYSMAMWLPPQDRVPYAAVRKVYWGEPSVKYHTSSSERIQYPFGIGYHNTIEWGVYNSRGELVSTQVGSWDSEPLYGANGKTYIKYTWNNFPSSGMSAAWVTTTGQAVLTYQEEATVRMSLGQYISPTYQEVLAADREANGLAGTFGVLQDSNGGDIGSRLYEEFWSNDLNGEYGAYYRHYQMTSPPMYGGDVRVAYYNVDDAPYSYPVSTTGIATLASALPADVYTGGSPQFNGDVYNFYLSSASLTYEQAYTGMLDRGDGVKVSHLRIVNKRMLAGGGLPGEYQIDGLCTISDSGHPSRLLAGATLARLTFSNYYVSVPYGNFCDRLRRMSGFIDGSYVEGYEDTLTFTPIEHSSVMTAWVGGNVSGLRELFTFYRDEMASSLSRFREQVRLRFQQRLREYLQGDSLAIGAVDTKVILRSAKTSTWAYRDPVLTVVTQDTALAGGGTQRSARLSYTIVKGEESVTREATIVGTFRQYSLPSGEGGATRTVQEFDNYYSVVGSALAVDDADSSIGIEPDFRVFNARYPGRLVTGMYTITGTHVSGGYAPSMRLSDVYTCSVSEMQTRVADRARYNFASEMTQITTSVPDFIKQYLEEVPIRYKEGAGTPKWVSTAAYDGQRIVLTWFGPKGKGAFALWEDTDTELEVYGQVHCRYVLAENTIKILQWVEVLKPTHTFTVPDVRRTVIVDGEEVTVVEDVSLPTAVAARPLGIPKVFPYSDVYGGDTRSLNCIVSFSNIKSPDVKASVLGSTVAEGMDPSVSDYVLSVFAGR